MFQIRHFWPFVLLLTCLALPACQTVPGGPRQVLSDPVINFNAIRAAIDARCLNVNRQSGTAADLQIARNDLVTAYMLAADIEYGRYEADLLDQIRRNDFASSISILTLTAVATVSGNPELARGFSTAAGLVAGGQKAYTTDQLLNQTISVLQEQMRASRAAQRERILTKLGEPYQNWTFCLALQDAQAYERAGTLNAALAEISATASAARRANEAAADAVVPMVPYGRGGLAAALRAFGSPANRALVPARQSILADLVDRGNILPMPDVNVTGRVLRLLGGSGPAIEPEQRRLVDALIADPRVDAGARALLQEAITPP
jgi:hypothetical protein